MRISTLFTLALVAMVVVVSADSVNVDVESERSMMKQANPVPASFRRPLIDNPSDGPGKKLALDTVAKIIAKEPKAASIEEKSLQDEWNGEDETPEERDARKQKVIRNEITSLKTLIKQGQDIIKVLPSKQMRLKQLSAKLAHMNRHKVKKAAAEKLAKQQALLAQVAKQEAAIKSKLTGLKATQGKLLNNINSVKRILNAPSAPIKPAAPKFRSTRSDVASESDAESEADSELADAVELEDLE